MNGDFFSDEEVFDMLGGLHHEYVQNKKTFYELNSGDKNTYPPKMEAPDF